MDHDHDLEHGTGNPRSADTLGTAITPGRQSPPRAHPGDDNSQPTSIVANPNTRRATSISLEKVADDGETLPSQGSPRNRYTQSGIGYGHPLPPIPHESGPRSRVMRTRTGDTHASVIDHIVPVQELRKTAGERLKPTIDTAIEEKNKYSFKAKATAYALNIAIGLQVLLGALTTGLSVVTTGRQTSIMTAILGGLSTIVASYLARARGSNEPELSITRVKDLEQFIRKCQAFDMDYGHIVGSEQDEQLETLRNSFEELLGNGNGERRLSPPV